MITEKDVIAALDNGLPTDGPTPFAELSKSLGCSPEDLIQKIKGLKAEGKIKRFGLVVKNRSIGFIHNAMVTINVADNEVDSLGEKVSAYSFVKLCYQRQRVLPAWNYNLYFMVHGKDRKVVLDQINKVLSENYLSNSPYQVLFSTKCLKQKGATYY